TRSKRDWSSDVCSSDLKEMIDDFSDHFIIIYCILILWVNIDYLRDYKNIRKGLDELPADEELMLNPNSIFLMFIKMIFEFIRRWIIYLLAFFMTESIFVLMIGMILFLMSLYDAVFNSSLAKVKNTRIGLYLAIADIIFITGFIIYLFLV